VVQVHEVSAAFYNKIASWGAEGFNGSILQDVMLTELPSNECFWIAQGGAMPIAEEGVVKLANEIEAFIDQCSNQFPWKVIVCCGTGCTSYFLSKYFADQRELHARDVEVIAVPCVSTEEQLIEQIQQLHKICGYDQILSTPTVLSTKSAPTRIFAQPCSTHMNIWKLLCQQTGIEFDLIYAPRAFEVILSAASFQNWFPECNIIYYHCGGTEGNKSQLARYKYMSVD